MAERRIINDWLYSARKLHSARTFCYTSTRHVSMWYTYRTGPLKPSYFARLPVPLRTAMQARVSPTRHHFYQLFLFAKYSLLYSLIHIFHRQKMPAGFACYANPFSRMLVHVIRFLTFSARCCAIRNIVP